MTFKDLLADEPELLFVYGTLLVPEVHERVAGQKHAMTPARLAGYKRYSLQGRVYPGIVEEAGAFVNGMLLPLQGNIVLYDRFEGDEYFRKTVVVESGEAVIEAQTYILCEKFRHLLEGEWSLQKFCDNDLPMLF